jgi:SAM-dependent methyltransferase
MDRQLVKYYRTAEDYLRYLPGDKEREEALTSFFHRYRRYFGRSVLDLACGGGVLGAIVHPIGLRYVGVDANPDMIREARKSSVSSSPGIQVVLGDVSRVSVRGRFDTLTLLGNALGHLSLSEMGELLRRRVPNVHRGSTFLIDFRDVVGMFWDGAWARKPYVQTHKRGSVVHRTQSVNLEEGVIHIRSRPSRGQWTVDFTQAIWSPFILETLMEVYGWRLVRRAAGRSVPEGKTEPYRWEDVYRFRAA